MPTKLGLLLAGLSCIAADAADFQARKAQIRELLDRLDFRGALEQASSINREWPDDVPTYQLLAEAHLGLGDYDEAEKDLQWMLDLRIGKSDFQGWLLLARFREVTGDIEGALEAINSASGRIVAGQERERLELLAYAARLHTLAGRLDLADRALAQAGENVTTLQSLARLRSAQGRRDEFVQALRKLVTTNPHPRNLYLLAEATGETADFMAFEKVARQCTSSTDNANWELVHYYAGRGKRFSEALEIARSESERRHDVFTLDALALALFVNGKKGDARAAMERVLAVGTRDRVIRADAARIGVKAN